MRELSLSLSSHSLTSIVGGEITRLFLSFPIEMVFRPSHPRPRPVITYRSSSPSSSSSSSRAKFCHRLIDHARAHGTPSVGSKRFDFVARPGGRGWTLMITYLLERTETANKDGTWLRENSSCCCLKIAGKTKQQLLKKIYMSFLPSLYFKQICSPIHPRRPMKHSFCNMS